MKFHGDQDRISFFAGLKINVKNVEGFRVNAKAKPVTKG
jgi:hypothetical protein